MINNYTVTALFASLVICSACSNFHASPDQKLKTAYWSTKSLYVECKKSLEVSLDDQMLEESDCNQKIMLFLGGAIWGGLLKPAPTSLEENAKIHQKNFDCAQREGYLIAKNPSENNFTARGVNRPATFVKWVDQKPERINGNLSESLIAAFLDACAK